MSQYDELAEAFLEATGAKFEISFKGQKESECVKGAKHDVYTVKLANKRGAYESEFTDSVHNTERRIFASDVRNRNAFAPSTHGDIMRMAKQLQFTRGADGRIPKQEFEDARNRKPSAYDVLACLVKSAPGSFENFCSEYGYDSDSIKACNIWRECWTEFEGVQRVFGGALDQLQEIC